MLPDVREYGSVGTSDLAALATVALALPVEPTVRRRPAVPVQQRRDDRRRRAGVRRTRPAGAGRARRRRPDRARRGREPRGVRAGGGARDAVRRRAAVCRWVRALLTGAQESGELVAARLQDPFGIRTLPQVHGALLDALAVLDDTVRRMSNSPAENPLVLPGVAGDPPRRVPGRLPRAGARRRAPRAGAVGAAGLARLALVLDPAYTGAAAFLGDGTPGASGVMLVEYVAASALGGGARAGRGAGRRADRARSRRAWRTRRSPRSRRGRRWWPPRPTARCWPANYSPRCGRYGCAGGTPLCRRRAGSCPDERRRPRPHRRLAVAGTLLPGLADSLG